jgi:hypothetical protein
VAFVPVVIGLAALFTGGMVYLNWDKIVIALSGKQVAVLGARQVGKTHLIEFLTTGSIPAGYISCRAHGVHHGWDGARVGLERADVA